MSCVLKYILYNVFLSHEMSLPISVHPLYTLDFLNNKPPSPLPLTTPKVTKGWPKVSLRAWGIVYVRNADILKKSTSLLFKHFMLRKRK